MTETPAEPVELLSAHEMLASELNTGVLAKMPDYARDEAREHWAGRPRAERVATRELATQEDWDQVLAARDARRAEKWRESVPRMYAEAHPNNLEPDQHADKLRKWWGSDSRILYLRSAIPGNGKTYAAYAVANAVCARVWCFATTLADLVASQAPREPDRAAWQSASQCDLLILDDLGQESGIGWEHEKARDLLHRLLSIRAAEGRRTVITTNRDGAWIESKEGYGSAIADRLGHDAFPVEFTGPSRRQAVEWGSLE